jgi:Raf kinase inhibitor-like YbhB/YbcL family protein
MRTLLGLAIVLTAAAVADAAPARLTVTSNAFSLNGDIPVELTCDGAGKAPLLTWSAVPAGTRSIAILVEDADAARGPFTHMMVTNVPPNRTSIDLGSALPRDASAARNDSGSTDYLAPCPEDGVHHYHYRVFALDARVGRGPTTRDGFLRGIQGHVLAEGDLVGVYTARR